MILAFDGKGKVKARMLARERSNSQKTFFSGVLLLTLSTVSVKVIGLIYKIPMLAYLGSEGMGYFNSAYEIYALFCVIATAGLPVALSVLISGALAKGEVARVGRIYRAAMWIFFVIGVLGSGIMVLFARRFCDFLKSDGAYASLLAISPTVFLICISSALRGYFQGYRQMLPTAVSQVLEALGKLLFGLLFARYALKRGYDTPTVAAFAGIGLTLGTLLSVCYLLIRKSRFREGKSSEKKLPTYASLWRELGKLAIPMTLGASLVSLTKLIDMSMILRRLQSIGYSEVQANRAYGSYTTLALSVFGLLPMLLNSIALPLVPSLSGAIAEENLEKQSTMIRLSYRLTAIFSVPAAMVISAFSYPILKLLFGHDAAAINIAAPLLSYLGVSVFLSCMITATNSVLHAYRIVNRPIFSMLAGAIVKIVSAYFLIGNPDIGILGAPISTFFCNLTVVLFNLAFAFRLCSVGDLLAILLRPTLAAGLAVGVGVIGYGYFLNRVGEGPLLTLAVLTAVGGIYLLLACLTRAITADDVHAMPGGDKLCRLLARIGLLRNTKTDE